VFYKNITAKKIADVLNEELDLSSRQQFCKGKIKTEAFIRLRIE
jgi:hypothetical protein